MYVSAYMLAQAWWCQWRSPGVGPICRMDPLFLSLFPFHLNVCNYTRIMMNTIVLHQQVMSTGALVRFWWDHYTHNSYETPPLFFTFLHVWVPVSPKSRTTFLPSVDYQAPSLGSNQMGKESEYTFAKLSGAENYKECAREMVFALKDSGLWGYVDALTAPSSSRCL